MHVAFVHRRGFGQFAALAEHLATNGHDVSLICETVDRRLPSVRVIRHRVEPGPRADEQMARHMGIPDHHVRIGHRVAETFDSMARHGERPDIVIGHIGWGSMMFVKDVLPAVPAIGYCEFFYRAEGADVGFAPDDNPDAETRKRLRLRNIAQLLSLDAIDGGVSPTHWQKSLYPAAAQSRIAVCHEGVDTQSFRPDLNASLKLPDGRVLKAGDPPIITFVARDLEPYRGFPQALEAAAKVIRKNADALFVFVGGDGVSYGTPPPSGGSWKDALLAGHDIPADRILFPGAISHDLLRKLYQISTAHIYLTYPFVLSWSVIEAMACGALIIGSETPPVQEVIRSGQNGLLVPFYDTDALANTILRVLHQPNDFMPMRVAARKTIERRFRLIDCLSRQKSLINSVLRAA
ncbi:glycosyltransferase family 4 protein [Phyllobacterium zundukense]|uniref:Glycosyl transferase n=1 Tax=Phyllobacterium zundukense TaxID=1867719 RepID=A0A2N9VQ32_9HYPH|nr:glycosyltransferase family 4 protein [Phyllobacterium zundukense]ATU94706.1 glycosyl transferase [Phyllobacterium zundukense]PIO41600.1 glycosyl transferase [Phyllobacterium zundukense]